MSPESPGPVDPGAVVVPWRDALTVWVGSWVVAQVMAVLVMGASGASSLSDAGPGWMAATAVAGWAPMLLGVHLVTLRHAAGQGTPATRIGLTFRPVDLLGVPVGVLAQIGLVWAIYRPLQAIWPDTFSVDEVEQRARELYDSASGAGLVLLVLVVVVGAPVVEEIVYRGLLQRSAVGRWGRGIGVTVVAVLFALVHFQPVEIPGLLGIAVVLGVATALTDRLGAGVVTHMAFNAAGLWLVARS